MYLVGHPVPPPLALETAALLACGKRAVLSHRSAAWIWGFGERPDVVDVTVVGSGHAQRQGIRLHRTARLGRRDVRTRHGLLVTAPERTIVDLAAVLPTPELARALDTANAKRLIRRNHLLSLLAHKSARRGAARLRALLTTPGFSRSEAERLLLGLIRRAGLPRPGRNVRVAGHEVDFLWPAQRLVVEVDSWEYHSDRDAFDRDRRRDADLLAAGYQVVRITWRQLQLEPEAVAIRLATLLTRPTHPHARSR